jgi:hypothetical protein
MKLSAISESHTLEQKDDGWVIRTPYGYIDYVHKPEDDANEIWWVESKRKGHGKELVDLMQATHPASTVAWGVTSPEGRHLMKSWCDKHPEIDCMTGAHEGQFDPFGHDDEDDEHDIY